jgi:hypothetical protein
MQDANLDRALGIGRWWTAIYFSDTAYQILIGEAR